MSRKLPVAKVSAKGAKSLRRGNPWCYRTELQEPPDVRDQRGAIVDVVDPQGNPVGQALYARSSPLSLRLLTRQSSSELKLDDAFFEARLKSALTRRSSLGSRDGYRLVHGESDLLPGLLVDRYGNGLTLQTLSEGMDARKEQLARALAKLTGATHVACRDDHSGRDFEKLPREKRLLVGEGSARFQFHEGANVYEVDLLEDMKTGAFLDQVDNHVRAGELASGEALDTFSYHGGFALALATRCKSVLAIEQDEAAAARAKENAAKNGRGNVAVQQGNAFDVLHGFDKEGRKFDTVVLDPPAFAKRKEGLSSALRAYRELNYRALRLLRPDGLFVTCSCSGKVSRDEFEEMVLEAAGDAKRTLALLERRGAGIDHPPLVTLPETEYLKVHFYRVLS